MLKVKVLSLLKAIWLWIHPEHILPPHAQFIEPYTAVEVINTHWHMCGLCLTAWRHSNSNLGKRAPHRCPTCQNNGRIKTTIERIRKTARVAIVID